MWKTQSTFPHSIPHLVEIVENFSPNSVENFIIVENSVEIVEKWGCGKFWGKLCGKPFEVFPNRCGKFCGKGFPQLPVENLVD